MFNYKTQKQIDKIKDICIEILLFPLRCICTPIYMLKERYDKNKMYSHNQIKKLLKFAIDSHLEPEYIKSIYIVLDDYIGSRDDCSNVLSYFTLYDGMNYNYIRVRNKLRHIYHYQKQDYIKILNAMCTPLMSDDEKLIEFGWRYKDKILPTSSLYQSVKDKNVYMIKK